ncbi:terminase, partial [Salmonella enterica subsp. enterica]|nr:terminase [Salmonella enterica subsp. enterica]
NSGEIIMATRWATDDLSGRVIANSSKAKVLAFPAINERGEALVPELHPLDKLLETKAILGDYFWSAMYQQSPKQAGGSIFKDEWIK